MSSISNTKQCIKLLLERVPELRPAYDEHINDYDGLLPHVFMGDVTRYVVQQIRLGKADHSSSVERILSFFNDCLASGSEDVRELIAISFIENLVEHNHIIAKLKKVIGPNLKKEINKYSK